MRAAIDYSSYQYKGEDVYISAQTHARKFYEGFGFPPLEAAALGTVSAVSNVSSMPEVCGDSVFYFNPFSIESMKQTIIEALNNQSTYEEKKQKLKSNLNRFSWEKNAQQTLQVYNHISPNSI